MSKTEIKSQIKTKNISNAMTTFASENFTPLNECDFEIEETLTFIKQSEKGDFKLFNEDLNAHYSDKNKIIEERIELKQSYTINAFSQDKTAIRLNYTLEMDEYACNPKIILNPNSHIMYESRKPKETYQLLLKEINKIKAKNSMLINIFDQKMISNLKAFTKFLYEGKFKKRIRIPLFDGIEPEVTRVAKLILWFEHKNQDEDKHQIIEVEKDEVIVEFKKAKYGKNGFNAYGKQLDKSYVMHDSDLQTPIDEDSIYIEENENSKLYKSKVKGFVHFNDAILKIDNKVEMKKLSRVQKSLAKEQNNNIEVHISQNDTNKDSVGEGVELTSETIHISGHIGANSILEAVNLQVDGATHQDSMQFAKIAKINRHKGTLRCHDAKIALLECGVVHATNIEVEASLGGVIYAQNVKIGHIKSNLRIYASNSIEIRLVSGEDNFFQINYKDIPILSSKIDLINEDIDDLKFKLEEAMRHNKSKVPTIKEKIQEFRDELKSIKESALSATIKIEKPLKGLNTIKFTLDSDDEIVFKTQAQSYDTFCLEQTDNKITLLPTQTSITIE